MKQPLPGTVGQFRKKKKAEHTKLNIRSGAAVTPLGIYTNEVRTWVHVKTFTTTFTGRDGRERTPYDTTMVNRVTAHASKPMEHTAPRVSPNGNSGVEATVTCQCGFMDCKTGATLWGAATVGGRPLGPREYTGTGQTLQSTWP